MPADAPMSKTILDDAAALTTGDRKEAYGSAAESFTRTGKMWGAILHLDHDVTPQEVALCFIAHKMSRESYKSKRDNAVDIAGYARLLDDINNETLVDVTWDASKVEQIP